MKYVRIQIVMQSQYMMVQYTVAGVINQKDIDVPL